MIDTRYTEHSWLNSIFIILRHSNHRNLHHGHRTLKHRLFLHFVNSNSSLFPALSFCNVCKNPWHKTTSLFIPNILKHFQSDFAGKNENVIARHQKTASPLVCLNPWKTQSTRGSALSRYEICKVSDVWIENFGQTFNVTILHTGHTKKTKGRDLGYIIPYIKYSGYVGYAHQHIIYYGMLGSKFIYCDFSSANFKLKLEVWYNPYPTIFWVLLLLSLASLVTIATLVWQEGLQFSKKTLISNSAQILRISLRQNLSTKNLLLTIFCVVAIVTTTGYETFITSELISPQSDPIQPDLLSLVLAGYKIAAATSFGDALFKELNNYFEKEVTTEYRFKKEIILLYNSLVEMNQDENLFNRANKPVALMCTCDQFASLYTWSVIQKRAPKQRCHMARQEFRPSIVVSLLNHGLREENLKFYGALAETGFVSFWDSEYKRRMKSITEQQIKTINRRAANKSFIRMENLLPIFVLALGLELTGSIIFCVEVFVNIILPGLVGFACSGCLKLRTYTKSLFCQMSQKLLSNFNLRNAFQLVLNMYKKCVSCFFSKFS